ncbi:toxin component of a toxin/antitoxin system [Rathayibacter sp. AY2B5]|nr:toxin component of a toxin/antitoxin system [Rathayibacter sp. AY2B5]
MTGEDSSAIAAHCETVREWARAGGPLSPTSDRATVNNRDWFVREPDGVDRPRAARRQLHDRLVAAWSPPTATSSPTSARSGRRSSSLARPGPGSRPCSRTCSAPTAAFTVDADEFKRALLTEAIKDGSYDRAIMPSEVRAAEAAGERFFPLELASLVHEESSQLAIRVRNEAVRDGLNVVIDTVLSSPEKAVELGQRLGSVGYSVEVIDVEVPFELSESRIAGRWQQSYERALDGADELGGRWVPSEYARGVYAGPRRPLPPRGRRRAAGRHRTDRYALPALQHLRRRAAAHARRR